MHVHVLGAHLARLVSAVVRVLALGLRGGGSGSGVCGEGLLKRKAFPAWEWMGDARGGAKRADPKCGALNHAWVPTENT